MFLKLKAFDTIRQTRLTNGRQHRGAAAIEFAIVAPVFFMFTFACIEFARVNMLANTAEIAATEGARAGVIPGATAARCVTEAQQELSVLGVTGQTITVEPATLASTDPSVKVSITIPLTVANGYVITQFFVGKTITSVVELKRER